MAASQARELEAFWEDGALVLRAPVRAFRRRGLIGVTLSPLLLGLLVPTVLWFGEPDDVEVLVLLALFGLTLLATTIAGIFLLTFAPALSARTRWVLRRTEAPDGSLQFLVSGRGGAVNFRVDSGSRGGAEQNGFPPSYRLVLYDPRGQQTCV
ncbi:MAG: hypothetical protein KC492_20660, partial [Myxococcales bacterium]|nr:hypothetical protein [Myxococcales bacterium]